MTHDQAPGVNAPTRCAKEALDPLLTGEAHLRPAPILTPGQALAAAAVLEVYGPHHSRMAAIIQALRDYADTASRNAPEPGTEDTRESDSQW